MVAGSCVWPIAVVCIACDLTMFVHSSCSQVMAPFTPFLTEAMYQNLAKALPPGE